MEILLKFCSLIHYMPPYCLLIVIPILLFGIIKKEFLHVTINMTLIFLAYVTFWAVDHQFLSLTYNTIQYIELIRQTALIAYPILFVAAYAHSVKILFISVNKVIPREKKYANNPSSSSTQMDAVG